MPISREKLDGYKEIIAEAIGEKLDQDKLKPTVDVIMSDDLSQEQKGEIYVYIAQAYMQQTIDAAKLL